MTRVTLIAKEIPDKSEPVDNWIDAAGEYDWLSQRSVKVPGRNCWERLEN
jgi:hypothetical protein